ncbi:XdhC family protein [Shewanella sp.]|uniref:XdhC family protein n=1 Tax=Shewanella sp. TaxID=50422 RepID=UPI004053CF50
MTHDVLDLLLQWRQSPDEAWVLAVLTHVQGSSYRKPGAMMLFHPLGKSYGMLSGGCLEADLRRHAQNVIQSQCVAQIEYDASDESDSSYQLGCGGIVNIMLVTVTQANDYLGFAGLFSALEQGNSINYELSLPKNGSPCQQVFAQLVPVPKASIPLASRLKTADMLHRQGAMSHQDNRLRIHLAPPLALGIFGAGLDAQPLAAMAQQLGWQVTVFDERSAYGRFYDFPNALVCKGDIEQIDTQQLKRLDAAVVMSHNLNLDAKALSVLATYSSQHLAYLALLGPPQRRDRVLRLAGLTSTDIKCFFSAPAGLALGGELPSSVALSILSQCHGVLHGSAIIALDEVMRCPE